jgi:hypothetical protein|tara:strand:+ start:84 stop:515 length:432 start_codon:yes stop_codon:yes gene_type:complete
MRTQLKVMPSLQRKIDGLKQLAEQQVERKLTDMAVDAVGLGTIRVPVDTGAYVTSFSFNVGAGRPRGKSSKGKPRNQNAVAKMNEGLSNLIQDIERIPSLLDTTRIELRNNSPHARDVERGEGWPRTNGYFVFTQLKRKYNRG